MTAPTSLLQPEAPPPLVRVLLVPPELLPLPVLELRVPVLLLLVRVLLVPPPLVRELLPQLELLPLPVPLPRTERAPLLLLARALLLRPGPPLERAPLLLSPRLLSPLRPRPLRLERVPLPLERALPPLERVLLLRNPPPLSLRPLSPPRLRPQRRVVRLEEKLVNNEGCKNKL